MDASEQQQQQQSEDQPFQRHELQALHLMDSPVWIFDIVRRQMWFANPAAVELWSASTEQALLERNFKADMSETTQNRLDDYLLKFTRGERIQEQWTFYPTPRDTDKDETTVPPQSVVVDCTCKGISIEEGRVAMLVQGIPQKSKTATMTSQEEKALRATEMIRHLPVAVCMTDLEGNVLEQNPEAIAVFGMVPTTVDKEKTQKEPTTFVKRFVDQALGARVLEQAKTGHQDVSLEALQHTVDGTQWSAIKVRQTKDPVTSQPILLYSARDITAVVQAQRQASTAELAKLDLLANMAHAVRTPLQHVVGVVELLTKERAFDNPAASHQDPKKFSTLLQSSAQLLMSVIHDLMDTVGSSGTQDATRIQESQATIMNPTDLQYSNKNTNNNNNPQSPKRRVLLEHAPIDIKQVLQHAVATIEPQTQAKQLTIRVSIHSRSLNSTANTLMGDANRLGQVLFEMLHNAVKHTSKGGITLSVRRLSLKSSRRVRLRFDVKDTGVGMNLEQQQRCLDPVNHNDNNNHKTNGNGVGLGRCKALIDAMGGSMGVQGKPGQGSTFWFEIPFLRTSKKPPRMMKKMQRRSKSRQQQQSDQPLQGSSGLLALDAVPDEGGMRLLLVDRDSPGRSVMIALLESSGYQVTAAETGDAMVEEVTSLEEEEPFDGVLLEIQLPSLSTGDGTSKLDALQATKELRTLGYSTEKLPILALTAAVARADYPELGLNDWLTKPMLVKDIQKAITNAICNMGAHSLSAGSIMSDDSSFVSGDISSYAGVEMKKSNSGGDLNTSSGRLSGSSTNDSQPVLPRRASCGSLYSAASNQAQTVQNQGSSARHTIDRVPAALMADRIPPPQTQACIDNEIQDGSGRSGTTADSMPVMPRRASLDSVYSQFADNLKTAMNLGDDETPAESTSEDTINKFLQSSVATNSTGRNSQRSDKSPVRVYRTRSNEKEIDRALSKR